MKIGYVILTLLLAIGLAHAQIGPATTVTARGEAAIVGGDVPAAREEALVDAQRNALEQALGVKVRGSSAVQDFALADDAVLSMIQGYVRSTKILSETRVDSILTLEVQCEVAQSLSDDEADKLVRNFSCVVEVGVEIDGQKVDDNRLEQTLSAELVKAGFEIHDLSQLASRAEYDSTFTAAVDSQNVAAASWMGRQLLSNIVLLVRARLEQRAKKQVTGYAGVVGVYAYDCRLEGRAVETESGRIIAQYAAPVKGVAGAGDTPQKAVSDALTRAQGEFTNDLVAQLSRYSGKKSRPITVEIEGLPALADFQKVKTLLNNIRFRDSEVSDLGFQEGRTSTFRFDYSENINLIALKLDRTPGLEVTQRSVNKVLCRYAPHTGKNSDSQ
jgi:hypothetical protein